MALQKEFVYRTRIEAPVEEVFAWHLRPGAFERLAPPFEPTEVIERYGNINDGGCVVLRTSLGPVEQRWVIRHQDFILNQQFRDIQLSGPFRKWEHTHRFEADGPDACWMEDRVEYALPGGALGDLVGGNFTQQKLQRVFRYRHRIVAQDMERLKRNAGAPPLKVLVSGSTGLIGSALVPLLTTSLHQVTRLVRSRPKEGQVSVLWNPSTEQLAPADVEGFDAVIHLAGESITGRWTSEKKEKIRRSRVDGTRLLSQTLARLERPPRVLITASATGIYGNRGEETLTEDSVPGSGFLAEVCKEWEAATQPAAERGIRVIHMRFGVVLSPHGGALSVLLPAFKLGVGGQLGNGHQYMNWSAIDDAIGAIDYALLSESLRGPINTVSPNPVRNSEFTRTLGRVLSRPTLLTLPSGLVHTLMGEMADEMVLASNRSLPERLTASGYEFLYPQLEGALRHVLGRTAD